MSPFFPGSVVDTVYWVIDDPQHRGELFCRKGDVGEDNGGEGVSSDSWVDAEFNAVVHVSPEEAVSIEKVLMDAEYDSFEGNKEVSTREVESRGKVAVGVNGDPSRGGLVFDKVMESIDDGVHGTGRGKVHFFGAFFDLSCGGHWCGGGFGTRGGERKGRMGWVLYTGGGSHKRKTSQGVKIEEECLHRYESDNYRWRT